VAADVVAAVVASSVTVVVGSLVRLITMAVVRVAVGSVPSMAHAGFVSKAFSSHEPVSTSLENAFEENASKQKDRARSCAIHNERALNTAVVVMTI
jgi:hypothetical protein